MKIGFSWQNTAFLFAILILNAACDPAKKAVSSNAKIDNGNIDITLLHINDVYEISALDGGKIGGMARVASLKKQLKAENPNTTLFLAGDFVSPSVIGTLKVDGKRVRGKQMIDVLNAVGVDWATFGNHEFDIPFDDLQERLNESNFQYVSGNVTHIQGDVVDVFHQFKKEGTKDVLNHAIIPYKDADGTAVKMGVIAVTLPFNKANYVLYEDVFESYKTHYESIKDSCDFVVAVTHLNVADDQKLAKMFPQVQLIMGGHDHENMIFNDNGVTLAKADANAKSAYIHRLHFDKKTRKLSVKSDLRKIDNTLADDPATQAIAQKWETIAQQKLKESGFNPENIVFVAKQPLEGREAIIRNQSANLPQMIAQTMLTSCKTADCAILNSGSIRIDDVLRGNVTEFDVVRILPFGGSIELVEIKGSLLLKTLEIGVKNKGLGGFLQYANITQTNGKWIVNNAPLDPEKVYKMAVGDFLMTGGEANMGFLKHDNPEILKFTSFANDKTDLRRDVRLAFIDYLKTLK